MAEAAATDVKDYTSFGEFFPFYLEEHSHPFNRRLHFFGTSMVLTAVAASIIAGNPLLLLLAPLCGYGFAWVGHFIIEKNRPATFKYPLWSLRGDFKMFWMMAKGEI